MKDDGSFRAMQHYWLTQGMARTVGVNLCAAITAGALSRGGLETLVARCEACGRQADCMAWLGRTACAEAPPSYCANRQPLTELRLRTGQRPARRVS